MAERPGLGAVARKRGYLRGFLGFGALLMPICSVIEVEKAWTYSAPADGLMYCIVVVMDL